jgi:hypothetical protein
MEAYKRRERVNTDDAYNEGSNVVPVASWIWELVEVGDDLSRDVRFGVDAWEREARFRVLQLRERERERAGPRSHGPSNFTDEAATSARLWQKWEGVEREAGSFGVLAVERSAKWDLFWQTRDKSGFLSGRYR